MTRPMPTKGSFRGNTLFIIHRNQPNWVPQYGAHNYTFFYRQADRIGRASGLYNLLLLHI
jgi:hypothetical protein